MQAAWTIKLKLEETMAILPLMALGMSCGVVIAQNHGRGQRKRVRTVGLGTAAAATAAMLLLGALVTLNAHELARSFTDNATEQILIDLLSWSILTFPLTGLGTICAFAMEGTGNAKAPLMINVMFQLFLRLILCSWSLEPAGQMRISSENSGVAPWGTALCLTQLLWAVSMLVTFCFHHRQLNAPDGCPINEWICTPRDSDKPLSKAGSVVRTTYIG